jgi:hypothetical protein
MDPKPVLQRLSFGALLAMPVVSRTQKLYTVSA